MIERVFVALYNPMIYESSFGIISIHKTRKGAEMAMEFHKEEKRKEWEERYKDENEEIREFCKFGQFEAWFVQEYTINQ